MMGRWQSDAMGTKVLQEWFDLVAKARFPDSFTSEEDEDAFFELYDVESYLAGVAHRILNGLTVPTELIAGVKSIQQKGQHLLGDRTISFGSNRRLMDYAETLAKYARVVSEAVEK